MKLLAPKKRKIAVFFTGGLGDTLLLVPLLKELRRKEFDVTCIFYSKYDNDCLFDGKLYNSKVHLHSKLSLLWYALNKFKHFANIYINHLGGGKAIATAAKLCSKRVTKTEQHDVSKRKRKIINELKDAEQNLYLLYSQPNSLLRSVTECYMPAPTLQPSLNKKILTGNASYFVAQVSAGNNSTPFKNWPMHYWLDLVQLFCSAHKNIDLIILGDRSETGYAKAFNDLGFDNCKVLIGKTSVEALFNIVAQSDGYIGLDSGIMHMAAALQKKTLTIFGASNEKLYGYADLDPGDHKVIHSSIGCRPCSSWKNANTSRVTDPMQCPDFACLSSIAPAFVLEQVIQHFNLAIKHNQTKASDDV